MNQVETVALWAGLLSSVVGIVLSIVAIVFSILVDRRSSKVSDHTIQALQRIESAVERLSSDTRDIIKAGWDRMLVGVGTQHDAPTNPLTNESSAKQIAAGIAAELRAELTSIALAAGANPTTQPEKLETLLSSLESSLAAQLKAPRADERPSETFDRVMSTVSAMSSPTYTLLRAIGRAHLTLTEYKQLQSGRFGAALNDLREAGYLVPVVHRNADGTNEPCYYLPPGRSRMVRAALQLLPEPPRGLREEVEAELKRIGYPSRHHHTRHVSDKGSREPRESDPLSMSAEADKVAGRPR